MNTTSLAANALMSLTDAGSILSRKLDHMLSVHGISFTEFKVLHHLFIANDHCMRRVELAESVSLTPSGVTRLLNPMEKIHLVEKEKNPRDARVSLVRLSETGLTIYRDSLESFNQRASELMHSMSPAESQQLTDLLDRLR